MFARLQSYILAAVIASALQAAARPTVFEFSKRQNITGDNNNNAATGVITNGNIATFDIADSNDVSGLFNAGSNNTLSSTASNITGNSQTAGTKRQTMGDNNGNSGNITNGSTTSFSVNGTTDLSGLYNVGNGNGFTVTDTNVTGNSQTAKRQTMGDNNDNSGTITNGSTTGFSVNGTTDLSGLYNVGNGNDFTVTDSNVTGNSQTAGTKRQTTGDNNANSGNITNGDVTTFGLNNSSDIAGLFNVGSNNGFNFSDSAFSGNNVTTGARRKRQAATVFEFVKRQNITGDNNNNAATGVITNGDTTSFSLDGDNDVSGLFNVGSGNTASASNSTITGNTETSSTRKRQTMGDNNDNSGDITVGDSTTFGLTNSSDVSGAFNAGSDNNLSLDNSTLTGNTVSAGTKRQIDGDNNSNNGTITNGNSATFGIANSSDVSGAFNAGSDDILNLNGTTLTGDTQSA